MALVNAFGAIALDATLTGGTQKSKIIDGSGNVISSTANALDVNIKSGAASGYTEDVAAVSDPIGNIIVLRRRDTLSITEVSTDGDIIAANATAKGELYVKHVDSIPATQSGGWNITNITGTVVLPTGASTSAKQPALGTAGAASTDVLTIQGISGGTAVNVNTSGSSNNDTIVDIYAALKYLINITARPTFIDSTGAGSSSIGAIRANITNFGAATMPRLESSTGQNSTAFLWKDTIMNTLDRGSWAMNVRGRIS